MNRVQRRKRVAQAIVTSMALLAVAVLGTPVATATPTVATEVQLVAAWTNDDGVIDTSDTGDDGGPITSYDAWGVLSSANPSDSGMDADRVDKDTARCAATITGDGASAVVEIDTAYPGYVCTVGLLLHSDGPVELSTPTISAADGLTIGTAGIPDVLGAGHDSEALVWVRVEQSAQQNDTLGFTITIDAAAHTCDPLTEEDIPPGAVLINASGLCTYFFDAKPGPCGPGWTEENPYTWHFVTNHTGGASVATLTALFESAGRLTSDIPTVIHRNNMHFYLYTATPDTLVGAYLEGIPGSNLVLAHTCNNPKGGHISDG